MGRHPLQHDSRSFPLADSMRNRHQPVRQYRGILRIRSLQPAPGHTVSRLQRLYFRAHRRNHSCTFLPRHKWQRRLVTSLAKIHIDKVHARGSKLHDRLVRLRLRHRQLHYFHDFRPADLLDLNGFHDCLGFFLQSKGFRSSQKQNAGCEGSQHFSRGPVELTETRELWVRTVPLLHWPVRARSSWSWPKKSLRLLPTTRALILSFTSSRCRSFSSL